MSGGIIKDGQVYTSGYYEVYSTEEQIVGVWIDGKPLYRKVIDLGVLPNTDTVKIPHNIDNLDKIISMKGMATSDRQNLLLPFPYGSGSITVENKVPINVYEQQGEIYVVALSDRSDSTGFIILEYTKTTD